MLTDPDNSPSPARPLAIIPAYNEAKNIGEIVGRLQSQGFDVLVVNDNSTDQTAAIVNALGGMVVSHCVNMGYGSALQTGYKFAIEQGYQRVVQLDGDGQHDPSYACLLLEQLDRMNADLVIGSRFLEPQSYRVPLLRRMGQLFFAKLLYLLTGLNITDPTSGFQALRSNVVNFHTNQNFPDDYPDANTILLCHRMGFAIREVPVVMYANHEKSMHRGIFRPIFYVFRMSLSLVMASYIKLPQKGRKE